MRLVNFFKVAGTQLGIILQYMATIVGALIIGFMFSWKMSLFIFALLPIMLVGGLMQMKMMQGIAGTNQEAMRSAGKVGSAGAKVQDTRQTLSGGIIFWDKTEKSRQNSTKLRLK